MTVTDVLTVLVLLYIGSRLVRAFGRALSPEGRAAIREIVRGLRLRHFLPVPFVLAAVVGAAVVLVKIPGLDFGWWTAIGGQGNPVFGSTARTRGTPLETIIPVVFIVLLLPGLPLFAYREEEMFRLGAESWSRPRRVGMAIAFGLVHALIGIPIAVALALSIGGAYFQFMYLWAYRRSGGSRRAAVLESTRAHLAYNATIVVLVLIAIALGANA